MHTTGLIRTVGWMVTFCMLLAVLVPSALAAQNNSDHEVTTSDISLQEVVKAWQARRDRIQSLSITWTETRTDIKGSVPIAGHPEAVIPSEDTTYENRCVLVVDRNRSRYTYDGEGIKRQGLLYNYEPRQYTSVFDGEDSTQFYPQTPGVGRGFPQGVLRKEKHNYDATTTHFLPLVWFYQPFDPVMHCIELEGLKLTSEIGVVDDRRCVLLEYDVGSMTWTLWADPHRDFGIVRAIASQEGQKNVMQFNISYQADQEHGWTPSAWDFTRTWLGQIKNHMTNTVTEYSINPVLDDAEFQVEFPPGTYVVDTRNDIRYLLLPDGQERPILRSERGLAYEQLLTSKPGELTGLNARKKWGEFIFINVSLVIFVAVLIRKVVRHRREVKQLTSRPT